MKQLLNLSRLSIGIILVAATTFVFTGCWVALGGNFYPAYPVIFTLLMLAGAAPVPRGALMVDLNQVGARWVYDNAKKFLAGSLNPNTGMPYTIGEAVPTMSYFRGEAPLSASQAVYNIPLIINNVPPASVNRVNQQLINQQDIGLLYRLSVKIGIGAASSSAAQFYTYPDQIAFSSPSGAQAALWSLYNGYISLLNNNRQVVPAFPMRNFLKVPSIQAITGLYFSTSTLVQQNELDGSSDTMVSIEPNWIIDGAAKMQMQITAASAPAAITTNSFLLVEGEILLFQNVTSVK